MSLLNDMLRDLSRHKSTVNVGDNYDDVLLQSLSIAQKKQSHSWSLLVLFFIIIFVSVLSFNYFKPKVFVFNKPVIIEQKKIDSADRSAPAGSAATTTLTQSTTSAPAMLVENQVDAELQNHIDDLLQQAERAIGMERLTAPIEDNAYTYYQKVLAMSPDNTDAKEGLDEIANRYLIKAQEQAQLGNLAQAEALVQRARFVSARFVQAHEISLTSPQAQLISESENELVVPTTHSADANSENSSSTLNTQKTTAQTTTEQATTEQATTVLTRPKQLTQASAETIKPFVVADAPSISVTPNGAWKDEQLARRAQELIQQNKLTEAQALLKAFIAVEQKPAVSAALLADTYIQQGNTQAAEIIVDKVNYLATAVKAKLQAQLLSANGDDAKAISVLEQHLNEADANENYRSLLASLYHKTANYKQSIISYQRLINSFGEKPAYWLGLALAYDGLSQHKNALQAYQQLREYPQLQEQVKKYTDQRIAALRSE